MNKKRNRILTTLSMLGLLVLGGCAVTQSTSREEGSYHSQIQVAQRAPEVHQGLKQQFRDKYRNEFYEPAYRNPALIDD